MAAALHQLFGREQTRDAKIVNKLLSPVKIRVYEPLVNNSINPASRRVALRCVAVCSAKLRVK